MSGTRGDRLQRILDDIEIALDVNRVDRPTVAARKLIAERGKGRQPGDAKMILKRMEKRGLIPRPPGPFGPPRRLS